MDKPAEIRLRELGITDPEEIDVEAIAFDWGAEVYLEAPRGCEASITGIGDRAIIRVDPASEPSRRRFSIAHECGHWVHHRGRAFQCRSSDIGNPRHKVADPERVADDFAADLLMPRYLFEPRANAYPRTSFAAVRELKAVFDTSLLATALRLVKYGPEATLLICHGPNGREWFAQPRGIERRWFPVSRLHPDSYAYDILQGHDRDLERRSKMPAEAWFDFRGADRLDVLEETIRYGDKVLSFITVPSEIDPGEE